MRPRAEVVAATLLTAALVVGCDANPPQPDPAAPSVEQPATPGASATPREPSTAAALPTRPPERDAAALAEHLTTAYRLVRDPQTPRADVRRAAELEQLAARTLAAGPARYADRVLQRLEQPARDRTRAHVEAAQSLGAMTAPQPELPDWRIVAPPSPAELRGYYRTAQRRLGVPWQYLAAIHLVETRMGRISGVSTAGAQGPMQFLPGTWELYGEGGDIHDPADAVMAAARLLVANGAPEDMPGALWHYNPSSSYVQAVQAYAEQMRRAPATYRGYWHWRVLYRHVDGTYVLEPGYPRRPATLLE